MKKEPQRPVDAYSLLRQIKPLIAGVECRSGLVFPTLQRCMEIIRQSPTVAEQPITRCRDCKYWIFSGTKDAQCITDEDWYCKDGESVQAKNKNNLYSHKRVRRYGG